MSKLAAGLGKATREELEALVGMGDTSVPGVEAADINDGDILANTRENVNTDGQFQFVYIPPDGSDHIVSDWLLQEHKQKVLMGWVEGVRGAIISRGQAGMHAANEAAMEAKLKRLQQEQMGDIDEAVTNTKGQPIDVPQSRAQPAPVQSRTVGVAAAPRGSVPVSSDPGQYVDDQLEIARETLRSLEQAQQDIIRQVITARRDYEKWNALSAALGGIDDSGITGGRIGSSLLLTPGESASRPVQGIANNGQNLPDLSQNGQVSVHSRRPTKVS